MGCATFLKNGGVMELTNSLLWHEILAAVMRRYGGRFDAD